ncbi:UDP-N-acetylmuramate--L-alanine ligase [Amycolatopsis orientalis]|uniref:UDP-N-acetylmuramate--L-alanine ligase n=1 Tax=Amycolatopsis orientalis TaxID=31958 RepID=UPI00068575D0|nr:UDP-N-acetylmuramate--L-alanine ligase [Amycolatopsis orientalis]
MNISAQETGYPEKSPTDLAALGRVHLVGCGGVGMASVAEAFRLRGLQVSGSEIEDRFELQRLRELGCTIYSVHSEKNVKDVDTVVYSTAVSPTNVELRAAMKRGIRVLHRSAALAELLKGRLSVAVTGTHGKTSTAAMLISALHGAGLSPDYVIGGQLGGESGAGRGDTRAVVFEADESDGSFLAYRPDVVVITNIDTDHLNVYKDIHGLRQAFTQFASKVGERGFVVLPADDENSQQVAVDLRAKRIPVYTFGESASADLSMRIERELPTAVRGVARYRDGNRTEVTVPVPGRHMAMNAAAAMLTSMCMGASEAGAVLGITQYSGVSRRFELKGSPAGIRVYDDYACHHTSIRASLTALRSTATNGRLVAVVEPCRQYRVDAFKGELAAALSAADKVVVLPVFDSDEAFDGIVPAEALTTLVDLPDKDKCMARTPAAAARAVTGFARPGDLVVTLGAAGMAHVAEQIIDALGHEHRQRKDYR